MFVCVLYAFAPDKVNVPVLPAPNSNAPPAPVEPVINWPAKVFVPVLITLRVPPVLIVITPLPDSCGVVRVPVPVWTTPPVLIVGAAVKVWFCPLRLKIPPEATVNVVPEGRELPVPRRRVPALMFVAPV